MDVAAIEPPPPSWADMEAALLQHIMQHVPPDSRLRVAAAVSSSWQKAAAAGTRSIEVSQPTNAAMQQLDAWLQQHGSSVSSLVLRQRPTQHIRFSMPSAEQQPAQPSLLLSPPAAAAVAATLTKLELHGAQASGSQLSAMLATLSNLRHLSLDVQEPEEDPIRKAAMMMMTLGGFGGLWKQDKDEDGEEEDPFNTSQSMYGTSLQGLTALTHLVCQGQFDVAACNSSISRLTNLQHLELLQRGWSELLLSCAGWERLQQLTHLTFDGTRIDRQHASSLQALTGLQELSLRHCYNLDTSNLLPITQLRSIKLYTLPSLDDLSAWLAQQQQLTLLDLDPVGFDGWWRCNNNLASAQELSRQLCDCVAHLTSLRHLQHLDLGGAVPLPVWQRLFAGRPGRHLSALTHLKTSTMVYDMIDEYWRNEADLEDEDVDAMVNCCPALQCLDAGLSLHHVRPQLSSLQHLTHLRTVFRYTGPLVVQVAADTLPTLSRLRSLELYLHTDRDAGGSSSSTIPPPLLALDVVAPSLSQLSGLTSLSVSAHSCKGSLSTAAAAALASVTSLVELDMAVVCVGEDQLLQLTAARNLAGLTFVALDLGAPLLSQLKQCSWATSTSAKPSSREEWRLQAHDGMSVGQLLLQSFANASQQQQLPVVPQVPPGSEETALREMWNQSISASLEYQRRLQQQQAEEEAQEAVVASGQEDEGEEDEDEGTE